MPQSKILSSTVKQKAQVIALNSRVLDPIANNEKQLRNFQLSDLLSRNLEIENIINAFSIYMQTEIPHSGYQYKCSEMGMLLDSGKSGKNLASYRLTLQSHQLGEITFYRGTRFRTDGCTRRVTGQRPDRDGHRQRRSDRWTGSRDDHGG